MPLVEWVLAKALRLPLAARRVKSSTLGKNRVPRGAFVSIKVAPLFARTAPDLEAVWVWTITMMLGGSEFLFGL
jgi:hypothetical protein